MTRFERDAGARNGGGGGRAASGRRKFESRIVHQEPAALKKGCRLSAMKSAAIQSLLSFIRRSKMLRQGHSPCQSGQTGKAICLFWQVNGGADYPQWQVYPPERLRRLPLQGGRRCVGCRCAVPQTAQSENYTRILSAGDIYRFGGIRYTMTIQGGRA